MTDTISQRRILVGVDGSESSKDALRWAIEQARVTGSAVDAVIAWSYPTAYGWTANINPDDLIKAAAQVLHQAVHDVAGHRPAAAVHTRVVYGHAAPVLIQEAADADLLVLGSRGHGGFVGALLGSVSQYCVQHARCPVVIVRQPEHGTSET